MEIEENLESLSHRLGVCARKPLKWKKHFAPNNKVKVEDLLRLSKELQDKEVFKRLCESRKQQHYGDC